MKAVIKIFSFNFFVIILRIYIYIVHTTTLKQRIYSKRKSWFFTVAGKKEEYKYQAKVIVVAPINQ